MCYTCAILAVRDRSGRVLSAGTASASSRKPLSGVFRHVLFPQDKEDFGSVTSHEENWFVFSRSHRPPLTRTGKAIYRKNSVINKRYTSNPYTRRLLREERERWDPAVR